MENVQTREMISALVDGQLRDEAFAHGVQAVAEDAQAREIWHTYHVVGDVLRSGELAVCGSPSAAFLEQFRSRLRQEPSVAPTGWQPTELPAPVITVPRQAPANDGNFRWKLVAGFASLAAVAAVGWSVMGAGLGVKTEPAQLAAKPGNTVLAESARGVMIRDPRLDEFLAAHRQLGGASALQMPAGFLRNATFDGPTR